MSLFGNALSGQPSSEMRKIDAWCGCRVIPGFDATIWRWDCNGHVIRWSDYGNRSSDYGWELDHILASALGGADHSNNIRALHWRSNATHGGLLGAVLNNKIVGQR
jgi:hypothetical protein